MSDALSQLETIANAPEGPATVAFFDMDGTLINGFSVVAFFAEGIRSGMLPPTEAAQRMLGLARHKLRGDDYAVLMADSAQQLAGEVEADLSKLGDAAFKRFVAAAIYPESRQLLQAHRDKGHRVAMISTATRYQTEPVANELGIDDVMCNQLASADGVLTGELDGRLVFGKGKLAAANDYLQEHGGKLQDAYFYSDGSEDVPLLEAVGHPCPTNPDAALRRIAEERDWPTQSFSSRGRPGIREIVRTGLSYGSFIGAAMTIAPAWLLNRSRREAVNLGTTVWGEVGSALTGIKFDIRGEEHVWSSRPAIFVFNHQSASDALIIAKLLRRDFAGIAKKELSRHPLAGPVFRLAETVFIDRSDTKKAIKSLEEVKKTLSNGVSIAVAPEGTRSVTNRLGRFKKGPFFLAAQAGVPVVPIVIHNSTDILPKGGLLVHPGTVRVDVLPPISTDNWSTDTINEHVKAVRDQFLAALGQSA